MTDEQIHKWGVYFRYFYFYEDMTFARFLDLVKQGTILKRRVIDWSKVGQ